ncbi:MAG: hypothetical protein GX964_05825 [Syntrophomonadaceae bacterium]|nr:hypothetical protein [Syntrophomonadaceae bacterium]
MKQFYADLHVHIGRAGGKPVKITASRQLTVENLLRQGAPCKGLDIIGVVDAASSLVLDEIEKMVARGELEEVPGGGLLSRDGVLLILGAEVETREGAHFISYLPYLSSVRELQSFLAPRVTNLNLSTQKIRAGVKEVIAATLNLGGFFCPAHAFTPHKGAYGCWVNRLEVGLGNMLDQVDVLELGLSADTAMASMIGETERFQFLSNSDAHSLPNVGREYNCLALNGKSFAEIQLAVAGKEGREIEANYGMHPRLGKYHRTSCPGCGHIAEGEPPVTVCEVCGYQRVVMGVLDRVYQIRDSPVSGVRQAYHYRVPLLMIPGVGPKLYERLLAGVGSEIEVLEKASLGAIEEIAGKKVASYIGKMRCNQLSIVPGGGGKYGKVQKHQGDD